MTKHDQAGGWEMNAPSEAELEKLVVRIFFMMATAGFVEYELKPDTAPVYASEVYLKADGKKVAGVIGHGALNPLVMHLMKWANLDLQQRTPQSGEISVEFKGTVQKFSLDVGPVGDNDRYARLRARPRPGTT